MYVSIQFLFIFQIFSILVVALEAFLSFEYVSTYHTMALYKGVAFYSQIWFALILYTAEIVFNIVLLVGAHKVSTIHNVNQYKIILNKNIFGPVRAILILLKSHMSIYEDI